MKTTVKILFVLGLSVIFTGYSHAQDGDNSSKRAFQFTFVTPLGTNGLEAQNKTNNFNHILAAQLGLKVLSLGIRHILKGVMDGFNLQVCQYRFTKGERFQVPVQ
jgi:hypothetical protein